MRIVVMGTGTFAEPTFEVLLTRPGLVVGLITQPDRHVGEKRGSTRQTGRGMKQIAADAGIPALQPESINTPEGIAALRELRPELLVVAAYGQILTPEVLAVPVFGGINVHASLLPKYRGAAPVAWAIWKGETKTGVTIIRMSAGLDAGEMLAQEAIDILPEETAGELETRLAPLGAKLALEVVGKLAKGPVAGVKQDATQITKAPKLKKEMGLIDWSKPAAEVCCQIRAMQPWPTAFTFLHRAGQAPLRLIVCRAKPTTNPEPQLEHNALAEFHNLEYVSLTNLNVHPDVLAMVPEAVARENQIMPLSWDGKLLKIITSVPDDFDVLQKIQFILNKDIQPVLADRNQLEAAINRHYNKSETAGHAAGNLCIDVARILVRTGRPGHGTAEVEILELQPAGKRRLTAEEFLRGHPTREGDQFGPETL